VGLVIFQFARITFIPAALLIGVWFVSQLFHAGAMAHTQTGGVAYLAQWAALSSELGRRASSKAHVG